MVAQSFKLEARVRQFNSLLRPYPPCQLPCGRKPEYLEKTHDFRQSVDFLFLTFMSGALGSSHVENILTENWTCNLRLKSPKIVKALKILLLLKKNCVALIIIKMMSAGCVYSAQIIHILMNGT